MADRRDRRQPRVVREVERKVALPRGVALPVMVGTVPGVVAIRAMASVVLAAAYHDTEDRRLAASGVSLRRREGGPDAGWHLKIPAPYGEAGRDEVRLPLDAAPAGTVPAALAQIVVPLVREAALLHLASVRTERSGWELLDADGEVLAEVVDDDVATEPGRVQHRQVEVEARVTDRRADEVLTGVVALLVEAGGTAETLTKSAMALGEVEVTGPVTVPPVPRPKDPAVDLLRHTLATGVRALLLADLDVRRDVPDAVHRMRVAARTLRSDLRTFAPLVAGDGSTALRDELRVTAGALGAARDLEVQLDRLLTCAARLPEPAASQTARAVGAGRVPRREAAVGAAMETLCTERHVVLLVDLVEAASSLHPSPLAAGSIVDVVPPLLDGAMRRLQRAVGRLDLDGPAVAWHRARVLAKRARYAADAAGTVLHQARRLAAGLAELTDRLGQAHDAAVALGVLEGLAQEADGPTGYALGLLASRQQKSERKARRAALAAWSKVEKASRHLHA